MAESSPVPLPPGKSPLPPPDPWTSWQTPAEHRLPFEGKMAPPTTVLSPEERLAALQRFQKSRRRRGFLIGLMAGQLLIIAMDFGGELAIRLLQHRFRFQPPPGMSIRSLVFIGMTAGIAVTALLIFLLLGLSGAGYVLNRKKAGLFTAVGRGFRRVFKAAWALGLTLGVIGGTAWFLIPRPQWKPTTDYLRSHGEKGYRGTRDWFEGLFKSPEGKPPQGK